MATTTNYSWTTPDDTALVKDGASAIRTLGSSVDTTLKNLNPSTTLGDIEYRSSTANTNTRLGIGSSGQVLAVSGGVPAWTSISTGGMTLISTTSLSGATTTINSFSGYNKLVFYIVNMTNATNSYGRYCQPNASGTISSGTGTEGNSVSSFADTNLQFNSINNIDRTDTNFSITLEIDNYASTTAWKPWKYYGYFKASGGANVVVNQSGIIKTNSAITSMLFAAAGGDMNGGTVLTYGVK